MTRREKLQEQYEDALFALLMDDLAVEEGKKAYEQNERLKADSSFEVPSESRKRCVETIARCCRKKQFQGISNRCYHAFSKVAVIAMKKEICFKRSGLWHNRQKMPSGGPLSNC